MAADIYSVVIAASGAVVLAGATYWFTKKREREAELRKEKLEHYKELALSISAIVSKEATPDGHRAFALACNRMNLIARQSVLVALQEYQQEIRVSNTDRSDDRHDRLLSCLFYEMRKDLNMSPKDQKSSFRVGLWASGQPPKTK